MLCEVLTKWLPLVCTNYLPVITHFTEALIHLRSLHCHRFFMSIDLLALLWIITQPARSLVAGDQRKTCHCRYLAQLEVHYNRLIWRVAENYEAQWAAEPCIWAEDEPISSVSQDSRFDIQLKWLSHNTKSASSVLNFRTNPRFDLSSQLDDSGRVLSIYFLLFNPFFTTRHCHCHIS